MFSIIQCLLKKINEHNVQNILQINKIRDLFKVKLYAIRPETKKREREKIEREKKREKKKREKKERENKER